MKLVNEQPNLSIVLPGPCNAKCKFCFWDREDTKVPSDYLSTLDFILSNLPPQFNQISLTGGEPTLSPVFYEVLDRIPKSRYNKVVLSTNGVNLGNVSKHSLFKKVDFINISRHHWEDRENAKIFGTGTVPSSVRIRKFIREIPQPITLNCVIPAKLSDQGFIKSYLYFAMSVCAKNVAFRKEHGTLAPTKAEESFKAVKGFEGGCPVCRYKTQNIYGIWVTWKASVSEPSKKLKGIYELVYKPTGLSADWEGKLKVLPGEVGEMKPKKSSALEKALKASQALTDALRALHERELKKSAPTPIGPVGCGGRRSTRSFCGGSAPIGSSFCGGTTHDEPRMGFCGGPAPRGSSFCGGSSSPSSGYCGGGGC